MSTAAKPVLDISHVTVKAGALFALDIVLAGIAPLSPPPGPKGRYALAKAAKAVGPAHQLYQEQKRALLELHAIKGDDDKPVTRAEPNGSVVYDLGLGFNRVTPAYSADLKALDDEDVVLSGCRMITRAELGDCPITVQQEMILTGILLEDSEPT